VNRISRVFENLRRDGRAGLVAYLTAGDPAPARTAPLVAALERGGADIIELGVPFSDPIADGPVIQRASDRALRAGTTLPRVLEIASEIRQRSEIPLVLFTYLNPVLRYGFEKLANDAVEVGIDGCLMTDLSVEEADRYVGVMRGKGLDTVFLAAPTSSDRRLKLVAQYSTGFVYLVSRTGVTGEQATVSASVAPLVRSLRAITDLPMVVGFGVSSAAQVREVCSCADAAAVGSAFVRVIEQCGDDRKLEQRLEQFTRELAEGLRR
jgi:tryptophan synthase alpha chain